MVVIGLVGGCGTGKTKVADLFEERLNAYIIIADNIGHDVIKKGGVSYDLIVDYFGKDILDENMEIDRKVLSKIVFNHKESLQKLNALTHPYIYKIISDKINEIKEDNKYHYIIIEAAILIESGFSDLVDYIWFIHSDIDIRMERLTTTRNISKVQAMEIIKNQQSEDYYRKHSDTMIDNSFDIENTYEQIYSEILKIEETERNEQNIQQ